MGLDANSTCVVLLGASTFPRSKYLKPNGAFSTAKKRVCDYFYNKLGVTKESLLDLFDSISSADEQDREITAFIDNQIKKGVQDLFVYYVGHGSFTSTDSAFYLAINSTRDNNPGVSSITIRTLANTIVQSASSIRTFIILDCCFAAAAGTSFMSSEMEAPAIQLKEAFATKGITLLCASSKDLPALIVEDRKITMFTESFNEALLNGDSSINNKYLSLRQIHALTYSFIKKLNPTSQMRPEIITPIQGEGDIADIPQFENFAFAESKHDILAKKREIEGEMIRNKFINLGNLFIDFTRNFDETESYNMESILLCSECYELSEEKDKIIHNEFRERKEKLYRQIMLIIEQIIKQNVQANAA